MDSPTLDSLRQEIDAIDGELHGHDPAPRRPGGPDFRRQAARWTGAAAGPRGPGHAPAAGDASRAPFPSTAVYRMWREMMCAFTLMQTPDLKIAICRPADQPGYWDLARDHFGCQIPFVANDTPAQVLAAVRANPSTIGVVPAPIESDATPWWPLLAGRDATLPNVVARLPFLDMPNARARGISALVLARMEPEDSGDDRTLVSVEIGDRPQPQPHRRRPGQGRPARLHLGAGPGCGRRASLSRRAAGRDRRWRRAPARARDRPGTDERSRRRDRRLCRSGHASDLGPAMINSYGRLP